MLEANPVASGCPLLCPFYLGWEATDVADHFGLSCQTLFVSTCEGLLSQMLSVHVPSVGVFVSLFLASRTGVVAWVIQAPITPNRRILQPANPFYVDCLGFGFLLLSESSLSSKLRCACVCWSQLGSYIDFSSSVSVFSSVVGLRCWHFELLPHPWLGLFHCAL